MTERPVPEVSRKRTDETVPITYDFANDLPSGVTVTNATTCGVQVAVTSRATHTTATDILSGSPATGTNLITQMISGGNPDCTYLMKFNADADDGGFYVGEVFVLVEDAE
jgi:hypothetical protein